MPHLKIVRMACMAHVGQREHLVGFDGFQIPLFYKNAMHVLLMEVVTLSELLMNHFHWLSCCEHNIVKYLTEILWQYLHHSHGILENPSLLV
jgi:hypothetical protein